MEERNNHLEAEFAEVLRILGTVMTQHLCSEALAFAEHTPEFFESVNQKDQLLLLQGWDGVVVPE